MQTANITREHRNERQAYRLNLHPLAAGGTRAPRANRSFRPFLTSTCTWEVRAESAAVTYACSRTAHCRPPLFIASMRQRLF